METNLVKFSAYVPEQVYLRFTEKAREVSMKRRNQTKGAIAMAVTEAMELWIRTGV